MYKLGNKIIIRLEDNASIPLDESNAIYQQYLAWVDEGNEPAPADSFPDPVLSCSPWQIRKALNLLELRSGVETAVELSGDQVLKDGWSYATEYRSDDLFVLSIGAAIGKTEAEIKSLIQLAATL